MPNFIDLFGSQIDNKKRTFIQYLTKGKELKFLEKDYEKQFKRFFIPIKTNTSIPENFEAVAVDASGKKREFSNGTYFLIYRASGIQNNGNIKRMLDTDIFTLSEASTEINRYFGRKLEHIELKVLESYLNEIEKTNQLRVGFIDGSIYNRLMSRIFEFSVEGDEKFMLNYIEKVFEVLTKAKEKNVVLIGVSKDSRESFFRNALLDEIYYEERDKLKKSGKLTQKELLLIEDVIKEIDVYNEDKVRRFKELVKKNPILLNKMYLIYNEYLNLRTDGEIMYRFAKDPGYTFPIEKGLGRREQVNIFKQMVNNTDNYISSKFRRYLSNLDDKEKKKFLIEARRVIQKFNNIPTFISYHILPDIRDNPIKIDVPGWYFKTYHKLINFPHVCFYNQTDPMIEKILLVNMKLYCGLNNYNLLLSAAHNDAVLREKTYMDVYEQYLQDKLELVLPYRRRTKRQIYG
ncbi:MAG: DNA double-strand break repair nuclease NurA [Promethearchaeota archaeon]